MKKYIIMSFAVLFLFSVSCKSNEQSTTVYSKSQNTTDKTESQNCVSTEQLEEDIANLDEVKNGVISCLFVDNTGYELEKYSITKRQTNADDKEDTIYCSVTTLNSSIRSTIDYKLTYIYYDVGGWILEKAVVEDKKSVPLVGVDYDMLNIKGLSFSKIKECDKGLAASLKKCDMKYYVSKGFIPNILQINKNQVETVFRGTDISSMTDLIQLTYTCQIYTINSSVRFTFDQKNGWVSEEYWESENVIMPEVTSVNVNWKKIVNGDYYFEGGNAYTGRFSVSLSLDNFDKTSKQVNVNYLMKEYESVKYFAKNVIGSINENDYSLSFNVENNATNRLTYIYNFIDDEWYCEYGALGSVHRT